MAWHRAVGKADWATPADLKRDFGTASILLDGRAVFNIPGNKYRLVVWTNYPYRVVYIRFVGTHRQYDKTHRRFEDWNMEITPIKNQRDYRRVLKEIEGLMTAKRNTPDGDRLDVLVTLVDAWERKHYPLDLPDAIEAIRYHMEQSGLEPNDLIPFIGSRSHVQEVLDRQRPLTLKMFQRLHEGLGIPAESLIKSRPVPVA